MKSESVVLIDAVRTPFGKAGSLYAGTRADDIMVRCIRGLLERNPTIAPEDIDDVAIAAAAQNGDQGMNIGRSASLLAGIPQSVPGYSVDRWCAHIGHNTRWKYCHRCIQRCTCRRRRAYGQSSNGRFDGSQPSLLSREDGGSGCTFHGSDRRTSPR